MDARNESGRDDRNRRNDEQSSNSPRADRLKKLHDELNTLETGTESQKNKILRKDLEGGDDRPREMRSRNSDSRDGDRRPWTPREGGNDRPRFDNNREGGERRPWTPREGGNDRPRFDGKREGGERRPWTPREGGNDRPRFDGNREGGERRPWTPREGGNDRPRGDSNREGGERRPWTPREGGNDRPRFDGNREGGERRPWTPREGGNDRPRFDGNREGGERRPWTPREGGNDRPRFDGNREGGERRPWTPREGGNDRPRNDFRREGGESRPWTPREGGNDRPRYDNDRPRYDRRDDSDRGERRFPKDKSNGRVDTRRKSRGDEPVRPVTIQFDEPMRLNRYIANAGVCSRRRADELIANGSILVNGTAVTELGSRVNPGDVVTYNDKKLSLETLVYVLLNKPKDFITTLDDPEDRRTVMSLVEKATDERIFPVGRLDRNTTGLLLLTNDGEVAQKLTHPSNEIGKVYDVVLDKPLSKADFEKISGGVELEDGMAHVDAVAFPDPEDKTSVGLEIHSGRNRIVRRIFESLGYDVIKLDRVLYAGLTKKDLPRGNWRYLSEKEIRALKSL